MKDAKGGVMYVGKAKILKNRVSSYFVKTNELSVAKRQMVAKIADIEIITCQTEVEALVLETNIIKHLTPKYNILMKDDKNLAYLKITNSPVPELIKTRQKVRDGGVYFGPYVSAVEQSVRALRRIFRIRNCRVKFQKERDIVQITDKAWKTIPCMDYYIWLCPAPCMLHKAKLDEHTNNIARVEQFLSGESNSIFADLEAEMRLRAQSQEYEKAQEIRDTIMALKWLHERQSVRDIVDGDIDICIQYDKYDKTYIALTQVRWSQIVGVFRHEVSSGIDTGEDIMIAFLMRQYVSIDETDSADLPDILLCQRGFDDSAFVEFLHSERIQFETPRIWPKKDLLDFTQNQLREYAYKRELATLENKSLTRVHMANVLTRLSYPVPTKWKIVFECYDISHTDGHFTYASRVCIVDGKPELSRYKKYKIKTLEDGMIDDYASHREVMMRRTIEWLEQGNFPHLIIIDGGKWQLSSAISGVKEGVWQSNTSIAYHHVDIWDMLPDREQDFSSSPEKQGTLSKLQEHLIVHNTEDLPMSICSIAKREEEIFIPESSAPIIFEKGTPELMVLQKARDESHRFSITANRTARMKSMKKNILEEIPWIGPITRKKLLKLAGSVNEIKNIKLEEIEKICTKTQTESLRDHWIL